MSYLDLDNLSKSFKDDKIISNLNAKIEKGEFFVVFGPSGSGKTVLLRLLSGIMMADSGEIKMYNQIINELHLKKEMYPWHFKILLYTPI